MKLFNKIAIASVGAALAFGVGVVSGKGAIKAANATATTGTYNLYTSDITEGDYIITGSETTAMNATVTNSRLQITNPGVSSGAVTDPDDTIVWTIESVSEGVWTIKNKNTGTYLVSTGAKNKADLSSDLDTAATKAHWTITLTSGKFNIVNVYNSANSVNAYLRQNGTYGFACYASGTGSALTLYKSAEGADPDTLTGASLTPGFNILKMGSALTLVGSPIPATATNLATTYESSNTAAATVSSTGVVTPVAIGATTITLTIDQNSGTVTKTASSTVAVTGHDGASADDAFDLVDAAAVCSATGSTKTASSYYVKGKVTAVSFDSTNGYCTATVSDGTNSVEFYRFYDVGTGSVKFTDTTKITVGDEITVLTTLNIYSSKNQGSYGNLVSVSSSRVLDTIEIGGTLTFKTVTVGDDFDLTGLTVTAIYSNEDEVDVTSLATLECSPKTATEVGTTLITVTASYNGVEADPASFNVTVVAVVATVTDTITSSSLDAESTSYSETAAASVTSGAVYKANSAKATAKDNAIQMRSSNSNSGIVTTRTGGKRIKSVTINVHSGTNKVSVYASATAYAAVTDLYDSTKQGTALKTASGTYTVNFSGDYQYFGVRSDNGAIYLTSVEVVYELYTADEVAAEIKTLAGSWDNPVATADCAAHYARAKELVLTLAADELETFKTSTDSEIANARQAYEFWCGANADATPYAGTIVSASKNVTIVDSYLNAVVIASVASVTLLGVALLILKKKKLAR